MDGLSGFDVKFKSSSNTKSISVRDVRDQPNVYNYTFHENYDAEGRRFVSILIPISDPTNPTRSAKFTGISILIPDGMKASDVANPILEEAKKISANRSSSNNPTTTKEMKDMAIPMAKQIIEGKTTGSTSTEDTTKPTSTADQISKAFEDLAKSVGETSAAKMQEYADRIKAGEAKEKVLEGLGKSFIAGVNALLGDATLIEKPEKVDIEKRREEELLSIKDVSNTEDPRYVSTVGYKVGNFWTKEAAEKEVNAKYDAELKTLDDTKSKSTLGKSEVEILIEKVLEELNIPVAKINSSVENNKTVFDVFPMPGTRLSQIKNLDEVLAKLKDSGVISVEASTSKGVIEIISQAKPVGRNQSMHEKLVDKLTSGKSIKAKLTGKTPNSNSGFVLEVDGKKVIIYSHNTAIKAEDFGKPVTLKLIPELKVEGIAIPFTNVIQVYSGDKYLGNVATTDYDTTAKDTLPKDPTEEEIRNAAENVVDNNEEVFATPESKMKALGYTTTDIKRLGKAVQMHIIKNEITKQQYAAEQKALEKLKVENKVQSDITNFLKDKFTGVKTEEALVKVYDELIKHATSKMKVTLEEINSIHLPFIQNLFNQAKIDLANQKDFSTLSVGDKLLLTDGRIVKVAKVNKTSVDVVDFNSIIENKAKLTSKQFNTDVKKVINDFNLKQDEIVSALDQNNLDDLSSILSKFTTQSFAIADEAVTDEDILEHFKACK
jgi:hypothetical protein